MDSDRATVELVDDAGRAASRPPDEQALEGGAHVGRYVILHRHGMGGMGHVYAAYDPELDRKVALKLVRPRYARKKGKSGGSKAHARMMREAQALARLSHPNVVAIHDVGLHDGRLFLAMDFVEGQTLDRWVASRKRTWREVIEVYLEAGRGLAGAHEAGLVHRDFKPQNAIVGADGRVRVLDFGLAHRRNTSESGSSVDSSPIMRRAIAGPLTVDGAVIGTPAYMAPEQHNRKSTDARTDQFAFCVCLWEALYHKPAFVGDGSELKESVTSGRITEPPTSAKVPSRIRRALFRGLSREPADRFPNMVALLAELEPRRWTAKQQVLLAGAAVAVIGTAAYLGAHAASEDESACEDPAEQLDAVWGDDRKERIAAAFVATQKPYAKTVWHTTASIVDAHARDWVVAQTAACEVAKARTPQAEREAYLRMACLQRRLEEISALADLYEGADATVAERAVQAANALGSVAACQDAKALSARTPTPDDAADRVAVAHLRTQLVQAQAQADAGKYEAALALARTAVADGRKTGFRPIEAEALVVVGRLEMRLGDTSIAEDTLRDAIVAAEAGGHTEAAARAWIELLDVAQLKPDLLPQTPFWERHAAALLEHLGSAPAIEARFLYHLGNLRGTQGKVNAAVDEHRKALAIREELYGRDNVDVGVSLRGVGYALQGAGRYEESLEHFRRSQRVLEKLLGQGHPEVASTVVGIAISQEELGQNVESKALYERAERIFVTAYGPDHPKVAAAVNNIATVLHERGDYEAALAKFQRAAEIWKKAYGAEHQDVALTMGNIGLVLDGLGRYEEALTHHEEALRITEAVFGENHPDLATPLINLGDLYAYLDRDGEALSVHRRAADLLRTSLGPKHPRYAESLLGVGEDHQKLGDVEVALGLFERARTAIQESLGTDHPSYAAALTRIGLAYLARGDRVDARIRLEQALTIYDGRAQADAKDGYAQAEAAFGLARAVGDKVRAKALAERARKVYAEDNEAAEDLAEVRTFLRTL